MTRELRRPGALAKPQPGFCRLCALPIVVPDRRGVVKAAAIRGAVEVGAGQRLYTAASWHSWCDDEVRTLWNPAAAVPRLLRESPCCAACGIDLQELTSRRDRAMRAGAQARQRFEDAGVRLHPVASDYLGGWRFLQGKSGAARALVALGFSRPLSQLAEVDHRVPLWEGGRHELANLQLLCQRCHRVKTKIEAARRAARKKRAAAAGNADSLPTAPAVSRDARA